MNKKFVYQVGNNKKVTDVTALNLGYNTGKTTCVSE